MTAVVSDGGGGGAVSARTDIHHSHIDGFAFEEPHAEPPLPDGFKLYSSEYCKFERLDFVETLYSAFKESLVTLKVEDYPSRHSALFGLQELQPTPVYLEPQPSRPASTAEGAQRKNIKKNSTTASTGTGGSDDSQDSVERKAAIQFSLVRSTLDKALGLTLDDPLDTDYGNLAITDAYLDLMYLAMSTSFSAVQLQQLLLVFHDTLADVSWMEQEQDVSKVVEGLVLRMTRLANPREAAVVETRVEKVVEMEEKIDPVALAQFEIAKKEAKGRKAAQLSEANLPRIQVPVESIKEVRHCHVLDKPPYFSKADVLNILDFFKVTLFQHWRLFCHVMTQSREVQMSHFNVGVEDPCVSLTPLTEAVTLQEHEQRLERESVETEFISSTEALFEETIDAIENDYQRLFASEGNRLLSQHHSEQDVDRKAKMSADEYYHTVEVLVRRVAKSQASGAETDELISELSLDATSTTTRSGDWYAQMGKRLDKLETVVNTKLEAQTAPKGRK